MEKSCRNCLACVCDRTNRVNCLGCEEWKPDYQTLESELQQYKEALRLVCVHSIEEFPYCLNTSECSETCDMSEESLIDCAVQKYLDKAKGG